LIAFDVLAWEVAGHVANFTDPQVACTKCHTKHRVDKIIEDKGMVIESSLANLNQWSVKR